MAQRYSSRPSFILGIKDEVDALDFDFNIMYIVERAKKGRGTDFRIKNRARKTGMTALRASQKRVRTGKKF